jgi:acetyltransferase-like isoleucine patch superfamily enzyme
LRGAVGRIDIHPSFYCDGDIWLGIYSKNGAISIGENVSASGPLTITAIDIVSIGPGTLFGPNVFITDHYHGDHRNHKNMELSPSDRPLYSTGPVSIGRDVLFGANSVVLSPAEIGHHVVVAANAVVKGGVPDRSIYTGLKTRSDSLSGQAAGLLT